MTIRGFHEQDLLYETVATAAAVVVFLQLNEFKLAERFKHVLEVLLGNAEVNVANVQAMERYGISVGAGAVRGSDLSVLLSLGKLDNDRNT